MIKTMGIASACTIQENRPVCRGDGFQDVRSMTRDNPAACVRREFICHFLHPDLVFPFSVSLICKEQPSAFTLCLTDSSEFCID